MSIILSNVSDATLKLQTLADNYTQELESYSTYVNELGVTGYTKSFQSSTYMYNDYPFIGSTSVSNGSIDTCKIACNNTSGCVGTVYSYNNEMATCSFIGTQGANDNRDGNNTYWENAGIVNVSNSSSIVALTKTQYYLDRMHYSKQKLEKYFKDINRCLNYIKKNQKDSASLYDTLKQKYADLLKSQTEVSDMIQTDSQLYANSKTVLTQKILVYMFHMCFGIVLLISIISLYLNPSNVPLLVLFIILFFGYTIMQMYYYHIPVIKMPNIDLSYYSRQLNFYN